MIENYLKFGIWILGFSRLAGFGSAYTRLRKKNGSSERNSKRQG
jgi:hypothetical protein